MKPLYYILDGHTPKPVSLEVWALGYEKDNWTVARDSLPADIMVSTVFLGLDRNHGGIGRPILFETMVFNGKYDGEMERYCTWEEAEAGHERWVNKVKKTLL